MNVVITPVDEFPLCAAEFVQTVVSQKQSANLRSCSTMKQRRS
ncbi:hypothetical protein NZD89_07135 [Alicyclobacillus fastidiosus]|uniref:Uncharacterized protein n=1 Tax=Alicyclobacillus fastidiosus TaxID=392011 RepID=A0ABY6ZM12_9BACL|nr:hypothetical protein [Alicyclobacillus fastidiosus]WAH43166.1 hypothetical protein NZD89_07135 [Alicyclobacillus fastidiosus]